MSANEGKADRPLARVAALRPYGRGEFSTGQMRWLFAFARLTPERCAPATMEWEQSFSNPATTRRRSNTSSGLLGPISC